MANEAGIPSLRTESAASAGPTARARLYVIELSATADCRCERGTRSASSASEAGAENALTTPSPRELSITTQTGASPPQASAASSALSAVATSCETKTSLRRSKRSAALPDHGARSRIGTKVANCRTPRRNGECVCRYTNRDAARFWNQVPLADDAFPTK
jgi:hypothetical protein